MEFTIVDKRVIITKYDLYQGEENGDTLNIKTAKTYESEDLCETTPLLHYLRADGEKGVITLDKKVETNEFGEWLILHTKINSNLTACVGGLDLQVELIKDNFNLKSEIFSLIVQPVL